MPNRAARAASFSGSYRGISAPTRQVFATRLTSGAAAAIFVVLVPFVAAGTVGFAGSINGRPNRAARAFSFASSSSSVGLGLSSVVDEVGAVVAGD